MVMTEAQENPCKCREAQNVYSVHVPLTKACQMAAPKGNEGGDTLNSGGGERNC